MPASFISQSQDTKAESCILSIAWRGYTHNEHVLIKAVELVFKSTITQIKAYIPYGLNVEKRYSLNFWIENEINGGKFFRNILIAINQLKTLIIRVIFISECFTINCTSQITQDQCTIKIKRLSRLCFGEHYSLLIESKKNLKIEPKLEKHGPENLLSEPPKTIYLTGNQLELIHILFFFMRPLVDLKIIEFKIKLMLKSIVLLNVNYEHDLKCALGLEINHIEPAHCEFITLQARYLMRKWYEVTIFQNEIHDAVFELSANIMKTQSLKNIMHYCLGNMIVKKNRTIDAIIHDVSNSFDLEYRSKVEKSKSLAKNRLDIMQVLIKL